MRLDKKVALVTSSRPGICASTAQQLAKEGAKVMICGRNAAQGRATVTQIQNDGGRASFILTDTAIAADVQAAIDETIATYGRLDILFNNASSSHAQDGSLLEVSEAVWDRVIETTLKGTFLCCQYALPFLQQSGNGTIINLIEQAPAQPAQSVAVICQGGIMAMTEAIAQQFSASAVTANIIWATHTPAIALSLQMQHILNGPARPSPDSLSDSVDAVSDAPDPAFTDIAEAVMYLATGGATQGGERLHGSALIVSL
jgi:NAD(P)-dependent dehydrogenase (short-subunit alcohol dehydrogenase family)